jgi:glyoxylase-like metal-dependent hydrolase (beta-lactamase superfamily II)
MAQGLKSAGQVTVLAGDDVTVHSFMAPEDGDMVCSVIIETPKRSIIVDAQLLMPYAQGVRMYAEKLGKPIDRVIVTHAHPDHFSGLEAFADLPIHATQFTSYALGTWGQGIMDFKRNTLGDRAGQYATKLVVPTVTVAPGSETVDGVELVYKPVQNSEQAEILMVELPAQKTIITSDVVYNRVHPAVGDKNPQREFMFDGWVSALADLQSGGYDWIVPGHGEPTPPSALAPLSEYIQYARQLFESGVSADAFKTSLQQKYPDLRGAELMDYSVFFLYYSNR